MMALPAAITDVVVGSSASSSSLSTRDLLTHCGSRRQDQGGWKKETPSGGPKETENERFDRDRRTLAISPDFGVCCICISTWIWMESESESDSGPPTSLLGRVICSFDDWRLDQNRLMFYKPLSSSICVWRQGKDTGTGWEKEREETSAATLSQYRL